MICFSIHLPCFVDGHNWIVHWKRFVQNFRVTDTTAAQPLILLIMHHSSYTTHGTHSPLLIDCSSSPLITYQSSYITHDAPLIIHHSSYTTHRARLIIHHSCTTHHQTQLIIHHSSDTTDHTPLMMHPSYTSSGFNS